MNYLCNCDPCLCSDATRGRGGAVIEPKGERRTGASALAIAAGTARPNHRTLSSRRRGRRCHRASEVLEPPVGAHLVTPRRGYTHHGIYVGDGSVIHYAGLSQSIRRGPVEEVSLLRFANGKPAHIECRSAQPLDEQDIVLRARSRLGENRYRLLTNNCEHFSEWSRFGLSRSAQVERWLGRPTSVAQRLVSFIGDGLWSIRANIRTKARRSSGVRQPLAPN